MSLTSIDWRLKSFGERMHSGISFMPDSPTASRTKSLMSENLRHSRTYEHWPRTSITVIGNANPRSPANQNLRRLIPRLSRPRPPPLRRPIARIPNPVPPPRRLREPPHRPTKSLTFRICLVKASSRTPNDNAGSKRISACIAEPLVIWQRIAESVIRLTRRLKLAQRMSLRWTLSRKNDPQSRESSTDFGLR